MVDIAETDEFSQLAQPYRRELLAHCYRMLGSVHEAEDLVQETYLRAWRAYDRFEGRSSLRTWLHRIATTACLTALESRNRRPLPTGLGGPSDDPKGQLPTQPEVPWLEPVPDAMVGADGADPAATVTSRESIRLALIAALQYLPARQRAVLILRDVLKFKAAEVAETVGISVAAVNSLLQRARAQLEQAGLREDEVTEPATSEQRELLERYAAAFENYDVPAMVKLFAEDVVWEMPPFLAWFQGAETVGQMISAQCPAQGPGDQVMVATTANGQPAFGLYMRDENGVHRAFQMHVLTLTASDVGQVTVFFDLTLFPVFGLPMTWPAESGTEQPPQRFSQF
nr:sigma-70 family RNA polymerase sigma factor [Phytoactinopolyspora endophytica]